MAGVHARRDEPVAARREMPRLEAVGAKPDERVAVELPDAVPGELALAEVFVILRIGRDHIGGEARHVARRDLVARPAPGVGEARMRHADRARVGVHEVQRTRSRCPRSPRRARSPHRCPRRSGGRAKNLRRAAGCPLAANMLDPPESASPSLAARAETGNVSSSFKRPEASSLKTTSAVRILVVEAGDTGASAFFCNRTLPELASINRA